jgi:hypothetical protein
MEGHAGSLATGAGTSAALAFTGFNTIAIIVGVITLVFACLALLKLVPRRRRSNLPATAGGRSGHPRTPRWRRN